MNTKPLNLFVLGFILALSLPSLIIRPTVATRQSSRDSSVSVGLLPSLAITPMAAVSYNNVTPVEAKAMIDTNLALVVLDVRNQSEYDAGHIRNAKLIPVFELAGRLNELNPSDLILVYCAHGGRSATASQTLVNNGFTNIYNMLGGISVWISYGYPTYVRYSSIQVAIDNASDGGSVYVSSGLYYEHLTVNKPLTLVGENEGNTIIDGTSNGTILNVTANSVSLSEFTIQNCGCSCKDYYGIFVQKYCQDINITDLNMTNLSTAIKMEQAQEGLIEHNNITQSVDWSILITDSSNISMLENSITDNLLGVQVENSTGIVFSGNYISNCYEGVYVLKCVNGTFFGNSFSSNYFYSIRFSSSNNSLIFHNNFLDKQNVVSTSSSTNSWDNGVEGNYWRNYTGANANLDGIGDTPQVIDATNADHYPLMGAFGNFNTTYGPRVDLISNSTISNFDFQLLNSSYADLKFNVTGDTGTQGFCRIGIPKALINGSYVITFDGGNINPHVLSSNDTYTYFYVSYTHSQHTIEITGTTTIPEFPTLMITILIAACTLLVSMVCRRKRIIQ